MAAVERDDDRPEAGVDRDRYEIFCGAVAAADGGRGLLREERRGGEGARSKCDSIEHGA